MLNLRSLFTVVPSLILVGASCTSSADRDLKAKWEDPPLEYRMNRNWHNIPVDAAGQDSLIAETLENGWGGLAMNAPFDHYLTDEGMTATKMFCDKAKEKGLDLWLYDELGYPSGNAGDLVIKKDPSWECMGIFMKDSLVNPGKVHFLMPPGEVIMMVAFPVGVEGADFDHPVDLAGAVKGDWLEWKAPAGSWDLFAASRHVLYEGFQAEDKGGSKLGSHYPSLMIPEVTRAFLDITHEKYAEYMGEDLGRYFTSGSSFS